MDIFEMLVLGGAAGWLIVMALIMTTTNIRSMFVFRILPTVLGLCVAFLLIIKLGFVIPPTEVSGLTIPPIKLGFTIPPPS